MGMVPVQHETVTVGRVHEALEKDFGEALGLDPGRERNLAVEEVLPDCRKRMLTPRNLDLIVVGTPGEGCCWYCWNGAWSVMTLW